MFTGIIQGTGTVIRISGDTGNRSATRMEVDLREQARGLKEGDSVAVNGVCLTAACIRGTACTFEMVQETINCTALGHLQEGSSVNVERSLRVGDRLEGHFVLGHVDGTGTISDVIPEDAQVRLGVVVPRNMAAHMVQKGSVAVDGISLTITRMEGDKFWVSLIPHTLQATTLNVKKPGDTVNIETDILGKYVLGENLPE